jgi:hypothetical protein
LAVVWPGQVRSQVEPLHESAHEPVHRTWHTVPALQLTLPWSPTVKVQVARSLQLTAADAPAWYSHVLALLHESTARSPAERSQVEVSLQLVVQLAPQEPVQRAPSLQLSVQLVVSAPQPPSAFQSQLGVAVHWQVAPAQLVEAHPGRSGSEAIARARAR